jgi:hypothetical protein
VILATVVTEVLGGQVLGCCRARENNQERVLVVRGTASTIPKHSRMKIVSDLVIKFQHITL